VHEASAGRFESILVAGVRNACVILVLMCIALHCSPRRKSFSAILIGNLLSLSRRCHTSVHFPTNCSTCSNEILRASALPRVKKLKNHIRRFQRNGIRHLRNGTSVRLSCSNPSVCVKSRENGPILIVSIRWIDFDSMVSNISNSGHRARAKTVQSREI
jgi:hypothetical protein